MLRQWNRNNRKSFMLWFSITDSFVKAFVIFFSCVFNDGNCYFNFELNPRSWIVVMVTYCLRWCAMNRIAICHHSVQYDCEFFTVTKKQTEKQKKRRGSNTNTNYWKLVPQVRGVLPNTTCGSISIKWLWSVFCGNTRLHRIAIHRHMSYLTYECQVWLWFHSNH